MVKLPSGHEDQIIVPGVTDKNGVIVHRYTYSDQSPGVTEVFVDANYDTLHEQTVTSFDNSTLDAGDYLSWDTTSVSGSVITFSITVEGYET